jgi:hypothetical protein
MPITFETWRLVNMTCHQTLDGFWLTSCIAYVFYVPSNWVDGFVHTRTWQVFYIHWGCFSTLPYLAWKKTPVEAFTKVGHSVDHSSSESRLALALRQSICVLVQSVWAGRCWELLQGLNKTWKSHLKVWNCAVRANKVRYDHVFENLSTCKPLVSQDVQA